MASIGTKKATEKASKGITRRSIRAGELYGPLIHDDVQGGAYVKFLGKGQPVCLLADATGSPGVATGADTVGHVAIIPESGLALHYTPIGTATIKGPVAHASGLTVSLDATNAEGAGYVPGGLLGPFLMTVNFANPPKGMFIRGRFKVTTAASIGHLAVGFRKNEAVFPALTTYDEMACLYAIGADMKIFTILNNGADAILDTTQDWGNAETHEFEVRVTGKGLVTFFIDGAPPTVRKTHQFDDTEVIVPFFQYANGAGANTPCYLTRLEVGTLEHLK
jgi:hypothetical protein